MTKTAMDKWKDYQLTEYFKSMPHFPQFLTRQPTAFNNAMDIQELIATYIKFLLEIGESQAEVIRIINQFIKDQYEFLTGQQIVDVLKETLQQLYDEGWLQDVFNEMWGDEFKAWWERLVDLVKDEPIGNLMLKLLELEDNLKKLSDSIGNINELRPDGTTLIDKLLLNNDDHGVYLSQLGILPNTSEDLTFKIQQAINLLTKRGVKVRVPRGIYMVKAHVDDTPAYPNYLENRGGILLPDNCELIGCKGAIFKAIDHNEKASNVLRTYRTNNITVKDIELVGGKSAKKEWNYGLAIQGGHDINISITSRNFMGDGINIQRSNMSESATYTPTNIIIKDTLCVDNGRQGMSIEEVKNLKCYNSTFKGTNMLPPMAGVDIEPAYVQPHDKAICEDIYFYDCDFVDNGRMGIFVMGSEIVKNVVVKRCRFGGNGSQSEDGFTNKLTRYDGIKVIDCDFGKGETFQLTSNDLLFKGNTFVDTTIRIQYGLTNAIFTENEFRQTKNITDKHTFDIFRGQGTVKMIIKNNYFMNMMDINTQKPTETPITAIYCRGFNDLIVKNNLFNGYNSHLRCDFYNSDSIPERLVFANNTCLNSRVQSIIAKAHSMDIINNEFIGNCHVYSMFNDFSRDVSVYTSPKTQVINVIGNYGSKIPTIDGIQYKRLDLNKEHLVSIASEENPNAPMNIENNVCDYLVFNMYSGSTMGKLNGTSSPATVKTIHKPLSSYEQFNIGDEILILEGNIRGYINQTKKLVQYSTK